MKKEKEQVPSNPLVFRQTDTIGAFDANEDEYLHDCFVDTGLYESLVDLDRPNRLLVGRTGSGKTALLEHMRRNQEEKVIIVEAERLSLSHISNSTIIKFLKGLHVKLDLFFKLLWRHVLSVEIIRRCIRGDNSSPRTFLEKMKSIFSREKDSENRKAIDYLESWGEGKFWENLDVRLETITKKFTSDITKKLSGSVSAKIAGIEASASAENALTLEEKAEIRERAQEVVNSLQMQELSRMMDMLKELLERENKTFYVLIDKLDENWVDDDVRFHLIRALIETSRDFFKVRKCKIIIALRKDLLEHVIAMTRGAGLQEEKILSNTLEIDWTREQLAELLDKRISRLFKKKYTREEVTCREALVNTIDGVGAIEYLVDRTLMRPRDVIHFLNLCIKQSNGLSKVSVKSIKAAESVYSAERLRFLQEEWNLRYPILKNWLSLFRGRCAFFNAREITDDEISSMILSASGEVPFERFDDASRQMYESQLNGPDFRARMLCGVYIVGIAGLKLSPQEGTQWYSKGGRVIDPNEVGGDARVHLHKMAWRALGIRDGGTQSSPPAE